MRILDCPECDWTTKPKHKRPKQALTQHRKSHGNGALVEQVKAAQDRITELTRRPIECAVTPGTYHEAAESAEATDMRARSGYLITLISGEQHFVPAEDHQETIDRHWFFRGGALKESFKRNAVAAVEVA